PDHRTADGRTAPVPGAATAAEAPETLEGLCRTLLSGRGEASGVALARRVLDLYAALPVPARLDFFRLLARDFGPDPAQLRSSWFNRGFLVLRRVDWSTPADILERIIRHEAVHAIRDWDDLRRRVQPPDRRCFAFFHPSLVDEPLIFVEVALTREVPASI